MTAHTPFCSPSSLTIPKAPLTPLSLVYNPPLLPPLPQPSRLPETPPGPSLRRLSPLPERILAQARIYQVPGVSGADAEGAGVIAGGKVSEGGA